MLRIIPLGIMRNIQTGTCDGAGAWGRPECKRAEFICPLALPLRPSPRRRGRRLFFHGTLHGTPRHQHFHITSFFSNVNTYDMTKNPCLLR